METAIQEQQNCDDLNPDINPGATDIPGNGIDENCNNIDAAIITSAEPILKSGLSVYPNPATNMINVTWEGIAPEQVRLFTLTGDLVIDTSASSEIKTAGLPEGLYLILVLPPGSDEYITRKIMIER